MYGRPITYHVEITAVIARRRPRVAGRIRSPVPQSIVMSKSIVRQYLCVCEMAAEDGSVYRQDCAVNIQGAISLTIAEPVRVSPPASDVGRVPALFPKIISAAANVRA